jgi:hypothetical protein
MLYKDSIGLTVPVKQGKASDAARARLSALKIDLTDIEFTRVAWEARDRRAVMVTVTAPSVARMNEFRDAALKADQAGR